jgi:hypothetical protein
VDEIPSFDLVAFKASTAWFRIFRAALTLKVKASIR